MSVLNSVVILSLFSVSLFVNSNASVWPLPTSIYLSGPPLPISPVFTFKTSSTSGVLKRGITRYLEIILQQVVGENVDHHLRANQTLSELVLSVRSDNESLQVDTSYGYILKVSNGKASIEAKTPYGALYGMETFSQLIVDGNLINSTVNIDDQPQYVHRGLMLDTGRRYFPFELVKNILDGMSFVKLNVLHLHILDWCRFSVQSKLYPELQEHTTQFYTQEEIKDLVSYAGDRGIRVIPEVESASHVAGMIGLINKTKGLRFCNVSGFLELYNDQQENPSKWTSRGTGRCPSGCGYTYSNAWKPKICPKCGFEIGGKHEPKAKKLKLDTDSPSCVLIVESSQLKLYSVQINSKHNRVFVVQCNSDFVCHSEKCKETRAVHVASGIPFSCEHCNLLKSFCSPTLAKNLQEDDIKSYKCDNTTQRMLIEAIQPPDDFRHVVEISQSCYAVYHGASQGPSNPTGYCHVQKRDGLFRCMNKSCSKKSGNSKQLKMRTICPHLHILFCVLKLSSDSGPANTVSPSTSGESSSATSTTVTAEQEISVSRGSTIKLNMRRVIPYPVPQEMLSACQSLKDVPQCFMPSSTECELCGSPLLDCRRHPGQGQGDLSYLITPVIFMSVEIKVKFCSNRSCKAMHQAWPTDKGLFNICDKIIVAVVVLEHWRQLFRRGVPLSVAIESDLSVWKRCGEGDLGDNDLRYLSALLYNGFYAYELLSERSQDSVICGICGVIGQVHFGDGNEKNCCSVEMVDYTKANNSEGGGQPPSLETFLHQMKGVFVERLTYANSKQDISVIAENVPPIIAPSFRADRVFNTEMEKKSVYLEGKFFEKDHINGDPMLLHHLIKTKPLDMASLESCSEQELRAICRECKIDKIAKLSKSLLIRQLQMLYSSLVTGSSPCHGFTHVAGNTGGFYHMVCRHGTTVASKFLLLQESVRDAADLYLSLKYPPVVLVNDTPCGFARHLDLREPTLARELWGDHIGCFEKPDPKTQPNQVSIPQIVPSEFSSINLSEERLAEDHTNPLNHPLTGSSRRYVVGDRFHTTTNPDKSHLCQFHDINLCLQRDTIKTSYQECQNNSKNIKRLRCSTMQSFPVHFIYNYLMDFYHNEEIVEKQRKQLASTLKEGQSLKRDRFLRFVVVSE